MSRTKEILGRPYRRGGRTLFATCYILLFCIFFVSLKVCQADTIDPEDKVKYVIAISTDGLVPSKVTSNLENLPNFRRLRSEGAYTDNARNEYDSSQTTPNHASMLTGLSIRKHKYKEDLDNGKKVNAKSIFNWVSGAGGKTCLFATKQKFKLFSRSWPVDVFKWSKSSKDINKRFLQEMTSDSPCNYVLLHWRDADYAGHSKRGADNSLYRKAVKEVDNYLGMVFKLIEKSPLLRNNTAIVLTADHGFGGENHSAKNKRGNYQIPFYVWGKGVTPGADLYEMNKTNRNDPGKNRPGNKGTQPIRTQDSAVVAADWLGVAKGASDLYVRFAGTSDEIDLLAPLPKTESPTKSPTWSAENWPGRWSSLLQIPLVPTKAPTNTPASTPTQPTNQALASNTPLITSPVKGNAETSNEGYLLYSEDFARGNGFVGLNRIPDPTSDDETRFIGKMKIRTLSDYVDAYHDAKEYGGIPLDDAIMVKLQTKLFIQDVLPRTDQDQIEFHMILRTDTGETIRGDKVYLSSMDTENDYHSYTSIVRIPNHTIKSLYRVRFKAKNLSSDPKSFPNTDPDFKTNLFFTDVKVTAMDQTVEMNE